MSSKTAGLAISQLKREQPAGLGRGSNRRLGAYTEAEVKRQKYKVIQLRPEIGRDDPLNLSISLSGGKETNKDSPSNGE